jgi:[acyl-carrier-protein] S-malonyltransferase
MTAIAAYVGGQPVSVVEVDRSEARLRAGAASASLPAAGTSEGRQLRRWLTQLLVTEQVVRAEAGRLGVDADGAPGLREVLPDAAARLEIGSVTAAVLSEPLARALFEHVTAEVTIGEQEIAGYHARNPMRFARGVPGPGGWRVAADAPELAEVRAAIAGHLLAAARRRMFRDWLDARRAELVELAPGYEHPGDPRQPDNVHRH